MSMRISTAVAYETTVKQLQERGRQVDDALNRVTSGKRVERASDDPTAAARAERAQVELSRIESEQRALESSRSAMSQTESALGEAGDLLADAREALLSAGNGSYSDSERAQKAMVLQGIRAQLLSVANRQDGAGNYVFGGQKASAPAFVDGATGVGASGAGGQLATAGTDALPLTVDGLSAWLQAPDGNGLFKTSNANSANAWVDAGHVTDPAAFYAATSPPAAPNPSTLQYQVQFSTGANGLEYTVLKDGAALGAAQPWPGSGKALQFDGMSLSVSGTPAAGDEFGVRLSQPRQSVFDTLDRAIAALQTPGRSSAQVTQSLQEAVAGVDVSASALSALRGRVGEALNRIDSTEERNTDRKLQAESDRVEAEDLDPAQGISDFQLKKTGYDAALKAYSMVQNLSLFNYIR